MSRNAPTSRRDQIAIYEQSLKGMYLIMDKNDLQPEAIDAAEAWIEVLERAKNNGWDFGL